jgi:hypothetical protein
MTGKGRGFCIKEIASGIDALAELGCRRGVRRWLRGCDHSVNIPAETKKSLLQRERDILLKRLESIDKQIKVL